MPWQKEGFCRPDLTRTCMIRFGLQQTVHAKLCVFEGSETVLKCTGEGYWQSLHTCLGCADIDLSLWFCCQAHLPEVEETCVRLAAVKAEDSTILLKSSLRKQRRVVTGEHKKTLESSTGNMVLSSPLHTVLLRDTLLVSSQHEGIYENVFGNTDVKQFQKFIDGLEMTYGSEMVTYILQMVHFSHEGLSVSTINKLCEYRLHLNQVTGRIIAILADLKEFLSIKLVNAIPHYKLKFRHLSTDIQKYGDAAECYEHIMEILSDSKDEKDSESTDTSCSSYKELLHTMLQLGDVETMLLDHVFNLGSLSKVIAKFDLFSLMHLLELMDQTQAGDKDIACLFSILKDLAPLLILAPDHFLGQFYTRSSHGLLKIPNNCAKMRTLVIDSKEVSLSYLMPTDSSALKLASQKTDFKPEHHILKLRTIKDDPVHILAITQSQLQVWNVYSRECIRTFENLKEPRDAVVVGGTQAAVLCGRELAILDLDSGELKSRLKGLLNVRMPYFGVHDAKHVMALSRNRMCVNMMNTETGDMVATFKVRSLLHNMYCR